jgi:hypothetical protein
MKKLIIGLSFILVIGITLTVFLWPTASITASPGRFSLLTGVDVRDTPETIDHDTTHEQGYYYLSTFIGSGSRKDPFRPKVDDYTHDWSTIDIRPDSTKEDGYTFVFTSLEIRNDPGVVLLASDLNSNITMDGYYAVRQVTGLDSLNWTSIPETLKEIFITSGSENSIKPGADGEYRIFLGGQVYGPEQKYTHNTLTDTFDRTNADALGTSSQGGWSWVEIAGDTDIVSNQAKAMTNNGDCYNAANTALSSADHYAQAKLWLGTANTEAAGVQVRRPSGTSTQTFFEFVSNNADDEWQIFYVLNDSWVTQVSSYSTGWATPNGATLKLVADGSNLIGYQDDVEICSGSNNNLSSNVYTGFGGYDQNSIWDDYEASELSASPEGENSPSSHDFGICIAGSHVATGMIFTLTNTGTVAIDVAISGEDAVGGDDVWTLSDTGTPGSNTYGLFASINATSYDIVVKKTATYNTLIENLGASNNQTWGLDLYLPTATTDYDGQAMGGNVTLMITSH